MNWRLYPDSGKLETRRAAGRRLRIPTLVGIWIPPVLLVALLLLVRDTSFGQAVVTPATQDPLMQLMLAQPKIDVDSPVEPLADFDPPAVRPGQEATYRVTLNALETAIEWPDKIPAPDALNYRAGAHGQILALTGPLLSPRTTFNFRVRPTAAGQYTIPEYLVPVNGKNVKIPAAQLEVNENVPPGLTSAQRLLLDAPTNDLYVGQTIRVRVMLPGGPGGMLQSLGQVQLDGRGFIVDQSSTRARIEAMPLGPRQQMVNTFVYELLLTPIATGKLSFFAQAYAVGNRVIGGVIIPSSPGPAGTVPHYTLLDSDPISIDCRPLPRGGQLPGFNGAVGAYSVDAPELSTNLVSVGETMTLKVKVRGEGNLARMVAPAPPQSANWEIFPLPSENPPPQIIQAQGFVTFSYTLVPLSEKVTETPPIPFSGFDPERGVFQDLTIESVPIKVLPGTANLADLRTLLRAEKTEAQGEAEPALSGLAPAPGLAGTLVPPQEQAWFPFLHLVPASGLFGLWVWERRRRFREQHPDIVLRRRARQVLRRQRKLLARAARARDHQTFVAAAVDAMTVAVAPHYPAEARALVGTDVLRVLSQEEQAGMAGQTISHLFSKADTARYRSESADTSEVLEMRPQIEAVLNRLEERLCD